LKHRSRFLFALVALAPTPLLADEIFFKNGDRLTGTIERLEDGKMYFKSKAAGDVQVKLDDLESFKSDQPLDVRLEGGKSVRATVTDSKEGEVVIGKGTGAERVMATQEIKAINPKEGWSGTLAAGASLARGNTSSEEVHANIDAERRRLNDRATAGATYLFGRQRDPDTGQKRTTTDNWNVRGKYDYFFKPHWYGYVNGKVEKDNIANIDLRLTPGVGMGYQFVEREDFKVSAEAGLTYVYEKFDDPDSSSTPQTEFREHNEYLSGRLAYTIERQFKDRFTLFHHAEYLPSFQDIGDYLVNADAGVRVGLISNLFLEYKFTLTYDAVPAPGASNTDLRHLLSVGWSF
jgi:putative salt-induced outer membrane protein YdiY